MYSLKHKMTTSLLTASTLLLVVCSAAKADSPATSTPFHKNYLDIAIVKKAQANPTIDAAIAEFLFGKNPLDQKAAVINALYTSSDLKHLASYSKFLVKQYQKPLEQLRISDLNSDDVLVLGYMILMENYFNPELALPTLQEAKRQNPQSYTTEMIFTLARAQLAITQAQKAGDATKGYCLLWKTVEPIKTDSGLKMDMRTEAVKTIYRYLDIYENDCEK